MTAADVVASEMELKSKNILQVVNQVQQGLGIGGGLEGDVGTQLQLETERSCCKSSVGFVWHAVCETERSARSPNVHQ